VAAPLAPLGADRDGAWRIGRGAATFAVSRHRDVWFAVRMRAGTGEHRGDPRYAFGLMAAKRRAAGHWRDLVPAAPRPLGGAEAPGPSLVLRDGTIARPFGTRMATAHDGTVTVAGGFRAPSGRIVRRGVRFVYAPTRSGVAVSFGVRARDLVDVADFRATGARPVTLRFGGRPLRSTPLIRSGYASATLGRVARVGARVRMPRAGTLTWRPG
jgi:hypothetical protein